jgi:hypothetical protein
MNSMARHTLTLDDGRRAFDELHRTPEFFKRFVERFMLYQTEGVDAAIEHTKESVFSDAHFLKQWSAANPADQAVLTLLANGDSDLHSVPGMARLTARLGVGQYRIEDEAYGEWIRRRTAAALRTALEAPMKQ